MRINGRILRASTLAERRLLFMLGGAFLRVPRRSNPYMVARRLSRAASGRGDDLLFVREMIAGRHGAPPSPGADTPEPLPEFPGDDAASP